MVRQLFWLSRQLYYHVRSVSGLTFLLKSSIGVNRGGAFVSWLTSEQQDKNEGKQVRVLRQHSSRHFHGHEGLKEARDLLLDQVVKRGAPGPSHAGRTFKKKKKKKRREVNRMAGI